MNRITFEFRMLCFDIILYVLGGTASIYAGSLNFFVEAMAALRYSRSAGRTAILLVCTYTAENIIDTELVLYVDVLRFIYTMIVLYVSMRVFTEATSESVYGPIIVTVFTHISAVHILSLMRLTLYRGPHFQTDNQCILYDI